MPENVNQMLNITKDMSKSIARMQDSWDQMTEVLDKQSNIILEIKEQSKVQGSHEISENQNDAVQASPIILESNLLEEVRNNEVEKIDQRDLLVISKKSSLISHIEFVILDEFKNEKIKVFLFTKMIKESMQMVRILILQLFKIRGRVFSNWGRRIWCEQASISMFLNLEDKIHLEGEGTVMTLVIDKLFEFSFVIE